MARKTILVIDDDSIVLAAVKHCLEDKYNIFTARDGHEGVLIAMDKDIDLIFLDIMMPGFDGFSTLLLLKDTPQTRDIPVIMLTAVGKKEKVMAAFRDGALDYILKPFKPTQLRKKVDALFAADKLE